MPTLYQGSYGAGLGSAVGQGASEAINEGLNFLTQKKMMNLQAKHLAQQREAERNELAQGYSPLFGAQAAGALSRLSPRERELLLQNAGSIQQLFGSNVPQDINQYNPQGGLNALQGFQPQQSIGREEAIQQMAAQHGITPEQIAQGLNPFGRKPSVQEQEQLANQEKVAEASQAVPGKRQPPVRAIPTPIKSVPNQAIQADKAKLIADAFTSPQEKREREKLELKRRQVEQKEKTDRFKATKEERKEIVDKSRAARSALRDLNRLEELEESGNLDTPGYASFLKNSGLDLPTLMNPESEEFQKIVNNFTRDAKTYFGGRVSNFEIEQFMKTIPSLSQSPEGRKRVIANLKYLNNAALQYNDALKDVMKENEGIPPYDLMEQVDDIVEKKQESLAEKFKRDLAKPVPAGQNRLITALQATTGSILGAPGKLLNKAGGAISALAAL